MNKPKIIFFGNGPLADYALTALIESGCDILFRAREKADLAEVKSFQSKYVDYEKNKCTSNFVEFIVKCL